MDITLHSYICVAPNKIRPHSSCHTDGDCTSQKEENKGNKKKANTKTQKMHMIKHVLVSYIPGTRYAIQSTLVLGTHDTPGYHSVRKFKDGLFINMDIQTVLIFTDKVPHKTRYTI